MEENCLETPQNAEPLWRQSRWYHAVTLNERSTTLLASTNTQPLSDTDHMAKAMRTLSRWKRQVPFDRGSFFAERLAIDSITEQDLLTLLAEPIEAVQARMPVPPNWLVELAHAFVDHPAATDLLLPLLEEDDKASVGTLLQPIQPLLKQGVKRLLTGVNELCQQYAVPPFDPETIVSLLFAHLSRHILPKLSKTLLLELNVASVQGRLQGDTAIEKFQSFLQLMNQQSEVLSLLGEYCVLARQLTVTIDLWVTYCLEFLHHLCADWKQIRAVFTPERDPGALVEVTPATNATHRGGRSVMLLKFSSGLQLVYKPKSLALEAHFQEVLMWLNRRGQRLDFRTVKIIDKGTYGWMEYVAPSACLVEEEAARFYERLGGYLALLYALDAADFPASSIIAAGEFPVLVDLAALFHPHMSKDDLMFSEHPAYKARVHSVLRVGLLSTQFWSKAEVGGADSAGLGRQASQEGQRGLQSVLNWRDIGGGDLQLLQEQVEVASSKHHPQLAGQDVDALHYRDSFISGFTTIYRLLIESRAEFLANLLPRFAHDEIRFVARTSKTYQGLLAESFHPNMLRDALKRERLFDRLWLAVESQPHLSWLIPAERADLLRGDIPVFTTRPSSRDLATSKGELVLDFFPTPGMDAVMRRIQALDEKDLARQTWMIQTSFMSMTMDTGPFSKRPLQLQPSSTKVTRERLMAAACAVGDRLYDLAVYNEDAAGWLGVALVNEGKWKLMPIDSGLYSGTPGIALFLGYLGSITGEARYTALARSALKTVCYEVAQLKDRIKVTGNGAFEGLRAAIYLFSHLGSLWKEPSLYREAEEIVGFLPELIEKDDKLDILGGSAGCIASLLCFHAVVPSTRTLAVAIQCGDHLLAHAYPMKFGIGWKTLQQERPLTGFSHGTAGIAWCLLKLAETSGEERYRQTARAALAYERSLFSPEQQNWPDLRQPSTLSMQSGSKEEPRFMNAWCHGAAGIGLARLASLSYIDDIQIREEIEAALKTIIAAGFDSNHSLCHGSLGNLETLLVASQLLADAGYSEQVERITAMILDSIDSHGWVTGLPAGVEAPGLMMGLSGIGYELLRLASPEQVPSVLLFAPPYPALRSYSEN